jgi:cytochrome c oxidase subunit 4
MDSQTTLPLPDNLPATATYVKVWLVLVILTCLLALVSRLGQNLATLGLLTLTPLKAGLVLYFFMHLKHEGFLLRMVVLITLGTLLIFFVLLFTDAALR